MMPAGTWLGLMGGGQLGRMFTHAAQSLGYKVLVVDPDPLSPAGAAADRQLLAAYDDAAAIAEVARTCGAVTTEFENVPAAALDRLGKSVPTRPSAAAVRVAQDREREKGFFAAHGIAIAPYAAVNKATIPDAIPADLLPGILKTARLGYDGKGQRTVTSASQVRDAFEALGEQPCVLEQRVPLALEISVLVARTAEGGTTIWPVAENRHRDGILDVSIVPARIGPDLAEEARSIGAEIARRLDYVGVLCVEMFVTTDRRLLVNEMAPRPHNSGHYSIDACFTSQFEQQCRVLVDAPLGDVTQHTPAVMVNLLGDIWFAEEQGSARREPDWAALLSDPRAHLHLYGKLDARRGRKMGHVTCLGRSLDNALAAADGVKRVLGIP